MPSSVTLTAMTELPTGAVTFLFTDIEGSTRLVKQLRDRYGAVLRDHQRLLRDAFDAHGGYEVDTQGDSFFVAFASAREALLAAVEGQLALRSHPWPDGVELKVRMGLHTGQASAHDGRYTGLAVHRAARIAAAGHGGQILVSQATQTLLEDEEEDLHIFLRDLGERRLKDLDRPVRLYQARADGLPESFPPVREAATVPPFWRRRPVLLLGAVLALAAALAAVLLLRNGSGGGLDAIQPNNVGVIDPQTNTIVAEIPVGLEPGPVAAGAGSGPVWVGNMHDRSLTRIDPATRAPTGTFSLDGRTPTGIAVGLGAVWVAHGPRGAVSLVDPQFGTLTRTTKVADRAFGSPNGSITLDDKSAWAVFGDSTLAHLDAAGNLSGTTLAGIQPAGVASAGGSIWVTNSGEASVQRFNAATFRQGALHSYSVRVRPTGIIYAEDAIWVASTGDGVVTRIDPGSGAPVDIPVGAGASTLASAAGSIWVSNTAARTVSRIDPSTNKVVATIEIGNAPAGIAEEGGLLWVAVQSP
ncbi:MAG: adenylate/guanylate cyclase domain-containing protein [Gaiellaceae bacterium]